MIRTADQLHTFTAQLLQAAGADQRNAQRVAQALVGANLCGVDTHGVWHLPGYVQAIRAGELLPTAWPTILEEGPAYARVAGGWTFGHVGAEVAMELALDKAATSGIALVSLVQAHHIGRLGEYVELAASRNMVGLVWAGGFAEEQPVAMPYGGRRPVLHTNPLAMGFPAGAETPMVLDFATTALSGVKVVEARSQGKQLPPGCIADREGKPTTDPEEFFKGGGHLPFGGHKGYGLMLAAELLGRVFTGSDTFAERPHGGPIFGHTGTAMIAFRADLFQPLTEYASRTDELEQRVRAVPPALGFAEVLVPGDLEARTREVRQREGIPIPDDLWGRLSELASSLGVEVG
ncbi:MAG: Ldh family oxidoreductase [Candidatus Latescibacteria bacterium]|nr:Ldh family oxidoreductase [Candidatus Latescibacterota bacterium]